VSEENVETVRMALRALDRRDVDGYLRIASPNIEVITPASEMEGASVGHAGMRRFFAELETSTKSSSFEVSEIRAVGPRVLALFTLTIVGRTSGAKTSVDVAGVYSFEDNKVRRAHIYLEREEALEAAGLRE
jgi:ketosteroid isomerase-like protein